MSWLSGKSLLPLLPSGVALPAKFSPSAGPVSVCPVAPWVGVRRVARLASLPCRRASSSARVSGRGSPLKDVAMLVPPSVPVPLGVAVVSAVGCCSCGKNGKSKAWGVAKASCAGVLASWAESVLDADSVSSELLKRLLSKPSNAPPEGNGVVVASARGELEPSPPD